MWRGEMGGKAGRGEVRCCKVRGCNVRNRNRAAATTKVNAAAAELRSATRPGYHRGRRGTSQKNRCYANNKLNHNAQLWCPSSVGSHTFLMAYGPDCITQEEYIGSRKDFGYGTTPRRAMAARDCISPQPRLGSGYRIGGDQSAGVKAIFATHQLLAQSRLTSESGLVSRVSPVQTALRNCTRDEGRSFEVGNQVLISSHRKLLLSKAMVVNVAEKSEQDSDRQG
jgi:hypothetical protein